MRWGKKKWKRNDKNSKMKCSGKLIQLLGAFCSWTTTWTKISEWNTPIKYNVILLFRLSFSNASIAHCTVHTHTYDTFTSLCFYPSFEKSITASNAWLENEHYSLYELLYRTQEPFIIRNVFYVILRSNTYTKQLTVIYSCHSIFTPECYSACIECFKWSKFIFFCCRAICSRMRLWPLSVCVCVSRGPLRIACNNYIVAFIIGFIVIHLVILDFLSLNGHRPPPQTISRRNGFISKSTLIAVFAIKPIVTLEKCHFNGVYFRLGAQNECFTATFCTWRIFRIQKRIHVKSKLKK